MTLIKLMQKNPIIVVLIIVGLMVGGIVGSQIFPKDTQTNGYFTGYPPNRADYLLQKVTCEELAVSGSITTNIVLDNCRIVNQSLQVCR